MIEGNNPVNLGSGLNWYLKYYCHSSLSFCGDQIILPEVLPVPDKPVQVTSAYKHNLYMNYCTFGYSTVFWDWERWEHEIDLMALNGITTPMAMVGAEVVWRNTLQRFGYTDDEIRQFLPGPPYLAWFLMGNMEGQGGPVCGLADSAAGQWMAGVGSTPEGIEVNPVVFDLANEMRWQRTSPQMRQWISAYARRRYGVGSSALDSAWQILFQTTYGTYDGSRRPSESVFCAHPSLKGENITASSWSQCRIYYDPSQFAEGVPLFLSASASGLEEAETYRYDAVDLVRQYLADLGREAYYKLVGAYKTGDEAEFGRWSARFLELIKDQDALLSAHPIFDVSRWLAQARSASDNKAVQNLYEYNARLLIGTWTPFRSDVRDYAHKEWGGMLRDYYLPRWTDYIAYLSRHFADRRAVLDREVRPGTSAGEEGKIHNAMGIMPIAVSLDDRPDSFAAEQEWVRSTTPYTIDTTRHPVEVAQSLFRKYYTVLAE